MAKDIPLTITVKRTSEGWVADMKDATGSAEILRIFGTYTIPTAFTANAHPGLVVATLERMNPEHRVVVEE